MILGLQTPRESSTAILYFTRSADIEARRKSLVPNDYKRNKRVVKALIDHTERIISKSGFSYFLSDSDSSALSFGEKLTQNIDHVFAQGYSNLIILGNDCPTLSNADILMAADILNKGHDTYGRAADGGLYLIGLQQESYHRAIFEKLSWSSETLAEDLDRYLSTYSREIHCVSKSVKADIDNKDDLAAFINTNARRLEIYLDIISIISGSQKINFIFINQLDLVDLPISNFLRGPPNLAA